MLLSPILLIAVVLVTALPAAEPDDEESRARRVLSEPIVCDPYVFSGTKFPTCDFANPDRAARLMGPYTVNATFYDRNYNVVETAEDSGRYGVVIDIIPETGRPTRRFRTLFRLPGEPIPWWLYRAKPSFPLPKEMGIDPAVAEAEEYAMFEFLRSSVESGMRREENAGSCFAGMFERRPDEGPAGFADDAVARDRQWWVTLKRKLYGTDRLFPNSFEGPAAIPGLNAVVIHDGTLDEAGMKAGAPERIDAVCREWAADSDEAFAVLVARHGVIVHHAAYGDRNGRPMTVNDPSWMASITKLLSGALMMQFVDHGLVGLDDPVEKFLPPFRNRKTATRPLTVRDLYVHTNGMWDHWGDGRHDFEEMMADYAPHLKVGIEHSYNGAGYSIAGKIMEAISGEAIPQLVKRCLFDPLGMERTEMRSMSWDAMSTPMEVAKFGQMLLNRGRYGNLRFFSEETFQKMLPVKLTMALGPDATIEWGIGATWFDGEGLGKGTFAHGAASAATLRIDPENDLIVAMTRNAAGLNFEQYRPRFISAVADSIAR